MSYTYQKYTQFFKQKKFPSLFERKITKWKKND